MASIAKLVVSLGANVAGFETDMQRASRNQSRRMKQMKRDAEASAKALGAAFTIAAGAIGAIVVSTTRAADSMAKMGQRLGASTEALSELGYVAERSGVDFRTLEMGLQRMTRRIGEVAFLGKGEAKEALSRLGLEAAKLAELPLDKQFEAIAEQLSQVENTSQRTSLAMKIFDAEGVKLVQLMGEGADGIQKLREEMALTGAVISEDLAAASEEFNDNLALMGRYAEGAKNQFVEGLLPALIGIQEGMLDGASSSNRLKDAGKQLGDVFVSITKFAIKLWGVLQSITSAIIGLALIVVNAVKAILAPITAAVSALSDASSAIADGKFKEAWDALKSVGTRSTNEFNAALKGMKQGLDEVTGAGIYYEKAVTKASKVTNDWVKSADKAEKKTNALVGNYKNLTDAIKAASPRLKQINKLYADGVKMLDELVAEQERYEGSIQSLVDRLFPLETATRQYNRDLADLRRYADEAGWSVTRLAEAEQRLKKEFDETTRSIKGQSDTLTSALDEGVRILERSFTSMWENLLSGSENTFDSIADGFKSLLANLVHQATTQKILVNVQTGLQGTGTGPNGGINWNQLGGDLAQFAGVIAGSIVGGGGQFANIGAALGAIAGEALVSALSGTWLALGSIGGPIGIAITAILGGLLGGLFDRDRPAVLQVSGYDTSGRSGSDTDQIVRSIFGNTFIRSRRIDAEGLSEIANALEEFDSSIAQFLSNSQIENISQALESWGEEMRGSAIDIESLLQSRFNVILNEMGDEIETFVKRGIDLADQMNRLQISVAAQDILESAPELFSGRTLTDFLNMVEAFQEGGEDITEAFNRMLEALNRVVIAQKTLRDYANSNLGDDFAALVTEAGLSLAEAVAGMQSALMDAVANFDGSLEQLETIGQIVMAVREGELKLLAQIDSIQQGINANLDTLREKILGLTEGEKTAEEIFREANLLIGDLLKATEAGQVADIERQFTNLINSLDLEDQTALQAPLLNMIDGFRDVANEMLEGFRDDTLDNADSTRDLVDIFLQEIGDPLDILAQTNADVADAVGSIDESISELGPRLERAIRSGFGKANINITVVSDDGGLVTE